MHENGRQRKNGGIPLRRLRSLAESRRSMIEGAGLLLPVALAASTGTTASNLH